MSSLAICAAFRRRSIAFWGTVSGHQGCLDKRRSTTQHVVPDLTVICIQFSRAIPTPSKVRGREDGEERGEIFDRPILSIEGEDRSAKDLSDPGMFGLKTRSCSCVAER